MNNIVTQRFIQCHNKLKESKSVKSSRQFALSLDYLPQSLSEILKGRRDVTIDLLRKAVEVYKINPVFNYTGDGPMFMSETAHESFKVLTIVTGADDDEKIVHVPVPAQAGYATGFGDPSFIKELPTFTLPDYKYNVGTHRCFDVSGDSMEPTLFEGDKLIASYVEPTQWASSLKNEYVYIIVTKSDVLVKRVHNNLDENNTIKLISDNSFYQPYDVHLSELQEIWYVRAKISPFLPSPHSTTNLIKQEVQQLQNTVRNQNELIQQLNITIERLIAQNKLS